jgi:hypothetical protein
VSLKKVPLALDNISLENPGRILREVGETERAAWIVPTLVIDVHSTDWNWLCGQLQVPSYIPVGIQNVCQYISVSMCILI